MPTKIRKQIYLDKRQDRQLKRLAEARGVSEAAVIRELIDGQAASSATNPLPPDRAAWEAILEFSRQRAQSGVTGEPYVWNRDEIYEERESRYGPPMNETESAETSGVEKPKPSTRRAKTPKRRSPHRASSTKKRTHASGLD